MSSASSPVGPSGEEAGESDSYGAMQPQMLVLIGSDGVRATVSHAIASEASYLLRDLLDGQDFVGAENGSTVRVRWDRNVNASSSGPHVGGVGAGVVNCSSTSVGVGGSRTSTSNSSVASENNEMATGRLVHLAPGRTASASGEISTGVVHTGTVVSVSNSAPAIDLDAELFAPPGTAVKPKPNGAMDLMDFFDTVPDPATADTAQPSGTAVVAGAGPNEDQTAWDSFLHGGGQTGVVTTAGAAASPPPPSRPAVIELPFPYFRGDILERVCHHMSYRFRTSTFGTEKGEVRVFCANPREVPKPMTMSLSEYLDTQDRQFVRDWDDTVTLEMLKAATLLNYESLYQLASAKLASSMMEKTVDGIRALLCAEGDFDATEEIELKKEQVIELPRL